MSTMKSPRKPAQRRASPTKQEMLDAERQKEVPFNQRMALMRTVTNVQDEDLEQYAQTELIRKSVQDVKMRAKIDKERRQSPRKTYSGVKSKVAGNMKSQKKAKKMSSLAEE